MEKFGFTTEGPRKVNEDSFGYETLENNGFFCVADGVGGNNCGEYASKFSVDKFITKVRDSHFKIFDLGNLLETVNKELVKEAASVPERNGMATTFVGLLINGLLGYLIHTGDSRLYLLRGNGLRQLTEDHTEARRLQKQGLLTFEQSLTYPRKHMLDSALGIDGKIMMTNLAFKCQPGDRYLLMTDGCYDVFTKIQIRDLSLANNSFNDFCSVFEQELLSRKLRDNATFVAIEIPLI
ncbi:MAG: serine/threonine-protein phosphatase [Chryseobacterium sp.]|nr:MAG: serine/threonine-protein phosphatase [Chryseobacterium sp.]